MLTDEQRIEACSELKAYWYARGHRHMDDALADYEREAKDRLQQPAAAAWDCLAGEGNPT